MAKKLIRVMNTAFRDGFQSCLGARVITQDFLPAVEAARAAGMKVVIYSKNHFNQADACTPSFTELPKLISSLT